MTGIQQLWRPAAAVLVALAVVALGSTAASAQQATGLIGGEVPQQGVGLLQVQQDASPQQVAAALQEQDCSAVSLAVAIEGQFRTYVPGAPAFVNANFPATLTQGTGFVVRCSGEGTGGGEFGTQPIDRQDRDGFGLITTARVASHDGYDRFVLEFADELPIDTEMAEGVPGYAIRYVEPSEAMHCGSGLPVEVEGEVYLEINFFFAYIYDPEAGELVVDPREITEQFQVIQGVKEVCGFEGQSIWIVGLSGEQPFRVSELSDPTRLVIDVATE